ncbi:hypothetical protein DSO57_1038338 [Entomophthora muscae]|uniref:Uncharacterized protein n=1 Tax=Entomophthora muscae TaxID=34485 RepID=A0ACC2U846_9FUNG|nr:hypothetical protein DSO57_1038338 [Entomophthora muscae]
MSFPVVRYSKDDLYVERGVTPFCIDHALGQLDRRGAPDDAVPIQLQLLRTTAVALTKDARPASNPDFKKLLEKANGIQFAPFVAPTAEKRPKAMYVDRKTFSSSSMSRLLGMFAAQPKSKSFIQPPTEPPSDQLSAWLLTHQPGSRILSRKPWKKRYFVLGASSLVMFDSDHPAATPLDLIPISAKSIVCQIQFLGFPTIAIQSPNHPIVHLRAENPHAQAHYADILTSAVSRSKFLIRKLPIVPQTPRSTLSAI